MHTHTLGVTSKEEKNVRCFASLQNLKMRNGKNRGITLIALVVTIVVLLILAGITINIVLGDNGIINMAKKAADKTNKAVEDELSEIEELNKMLHDIENRGGVTPEKPGTPVKELIDQKVEKNTKAEDEYGNKIIIPEGFKIVKDLSTNDVDYNYTGTTTESRR